MTAGQVIVILTLLAQCYRVNPAAMICISHYESGHDVTAINGRHVSNVQWDRNTFEWIGNKALADPLVPHREYLLAHFTPDDPLAAMIVFAWALAHGYESHWQTYRLCNDIQPLRLHGRLEGRIP